MEGGGIAKWRTFVGVVVCVCVGVLGVSVFLSALGKLGLFVLFCFSCMG